MATQYYSASRQQLQIKDISVGTWIETSTSNTKKVIGVITRVEKGIEYTSGKNETGQNKVYFDVNFTDGLCSFSNDDIEEFNLKLVNFQYLSY